MTSNKKKDEPKSGTIALQEDGSIPPFSSLFVSTIATEIYTNVIFNQKNLFEAFDIPIDDSITYNIKKKTKEIDRKTVSAPRGKIWNVQLGPKQKGLILPRKKKAHFRNQIEFYISLGPRYNVNVMMFNTNFKTTGTKSPEDTREAVFYIWRDYLSKMKDGYHLRPEFINDKKYTFLFDITMRNHRSCLDFPIDQKKLNVLVNSKKYSSTISIAQIVNSSVNIKFSSPRPIDFLFPVISFSQTDPFDFSISHQEDNPYENKKKVNEKKKKTAVKPPVTTVIIFSSARFIITGRYSNRMEEIYNFFIKEILLNQDKIEFKEVVPKESFF